MSKKENANNQRERVLKRKTIEMLSILAISMVCMMDMMALYFQYGVSAKPLLLLLAVLQIFL